MRKEEVFKAIVAEDARGRVLVPLPFDPDAAWGNKSAHRVSGTVNGIPVRAVIEPFGDGSGILLGTAWLRGCAIRPRDQVEVTLVPEGPQRDDLPEDVAAALEAEPEAGAFFDSLAQFYRKAYLKWIDGTKGRPEEKAARIERTVQLLKDGIKERP